MLKVGDKVTTHVGARYPRDHKNFVRIAKIINRGVVGTVKRVYATKKEYRKFDFDGPCACVSFPNTPWEDGVVSEVSKLHKIVLKK